MAKRSDAQGDRSAALTRVVRLVTAADGDTVYRDVYLRRAAELLSPIVSEDHFLSALTSGERHARLLAQAQAAVARRDWTAVRELGAEAAGLQRTLESDKEGVAAAETVYGAPAVVLDPLSPGLSTKRWSSPAQAHADVTAALAELAKSDAALRDLYASRQRAVAQVDVPRADASAAEAADVSAASVEQQALKALERGDAAALEGLANAMLGRRADAPAGGGEGGGASAAGIAVPESLGEPIPSASIPKAKALGLEAVETGLVDPAIAGAIAQFLERYALGASPAVFDRTKEGVARLTTAAKDIAIPPDLAAIFAETISLFALHLYVNSAGVRYVPVPAPREATLVEGHADGDETVTPLLRELSMDRRRGVSRDDIEDRLHRHGARVLGDLGLDPLQFRLVCVPPDLFIRAGRERGWGTRPEWTHFDGYQVMKGGRLRALVGGNAQFGGLFDLASISPDDARENTVTRFAVIRRERLGVRIR